MRGARCGPVRLLINKDAVYQPGGPLRVTLRKETAVAVEQARVGTDAHELRPRCGQPQGLRKVRSVGRGCWPCLSLLTDSARHGRVSRAQSATLIPQGPPQAAGMASCGAPKEYCDAATTVASLSTCGGHRLSRYCRRAGLKCGEARHLQTSTCQRQASDRPGRPQAGCRQAAGRLQTWAIGNSPLHIPLRHMMPTLSLSTGRRAARPCAPSTRAAARTQRWPARPCVRCQGGGGH